MSTRLYVSTNEASFFNTNIMGCASNPPGEGSYNIGDFLISTIQKEGIFGWVCTKSGTPGTWEEICNIGNITDSIERNTSKIAELSIKVDEAVEIVEKLQLSAGIDLVKLEKDVKELSNTVTNQGKDLTSLQNVDTDVKSSLNTISNTVSKNRDEISDLKTQVGLNDKDIDILKSVDNDIKASISQTQTIATINKDNISNLQTTVGVNSNSIGSLQTNISSLRSDLNAIQADLSISGSDITDVRTQISLNSRDISTLESRINDVIADVDAIENNLNLSGTDIVDISKGVSNNAKDIDNLEAQVSTINTEINGLKSEDVNLKTDINNLKTRVDLTEKDITNLKTQSGNTVNDVSVLKSDNTTNKTEISNLKTQMNINEKDINTLEGKVESLITDMDALEGTLNLSGTDILDISKGVSNNAKDIDNLEAKVATIETDVNLLKTDNTTNKTEISNLKTIANNLQTNGATLSSRIDTNVANIANLQNELKDHKSTSNESHTNFTNRLDLIANSVNTDIANLESLKHGMINALHSKNIEAQENETWLQLFTKLVSITNVIEYPCTYISLNNTDIEFNEIGQVQLLQANVLPENTTDKITWLSTNTNVVKVNEGGIAISVGSGECIIYASCGDKKAQCNVNVNVNIYECSGIALDTSKLTLYATGDKYTLIPTLNPDGCTDPIYWFSSNPFVATVDSSGLVNPINPGFATITAKCGIYAATCHVIVNTRHICTDLYFIVESVTVGLGTTKYYLAQYLNVKPLVCTDTVYWASTDIGVATIDENGFVTPIATGTTHISVVCGEQKATIPFHVEDDTSNTPIEPR